MQKCWMSTSQGPPDSWKMQSCAFVPREVASVAHCEYAASGWLFLVADTLVCSVLGHLNTLTW